jgi:hypothetical protein
VLQHCKTYFGGSQYCRCTRSRVVMALPMRALFVRSRFFQEALHHQAIDFGLVYFKRAAACRTTRRRRMPRGRKLNRRLPRGLRPPPRAHSSDSIATIAATNGAGGRVLNSGPMPRPMRLSGPARSTVHYRIPIGGSRAARRGRTLVSGSMPAGTR